jgi:outer membrane receptor protein involved in Fe transport
LGRATGSGWKHAAAAILLLSLYVRPVHAQSMVFDIPSQNVGSAVALFARQANVQILVPQSLAHDRRSAPVRGSYDIDGGLGAMLKGTGLEARKVGDGVYALTLMAPAISKPAALAPVAAAAPAPIEEVVITGTRIRRPNAVSASPVTSIDRDDLQFEGVLNLEEAINRLTSVRADSTQFQNGSDVQGRAKINLRNLGWQRNLVLLDGQRLLPVQAIDLNIIPSALVRRVDVLTGGASSTYGSDAIAGVVNFVLDKHFNGIQVNANYGFYQHDNDDQAVRAAIARYPNIKVPSKSVYDGGRTDINFAAGKDFGGHRGNISVFADYRKQDPVLWSDRDYSACRVNVTASGYACAVNTLYSEYGTFMPDAGVASGNTYHLAKDGSQTFVTGNSAYAFNTRERFAFMRSDERFTGGVFANYKLTDHAEVYGTYLYMKDTTSSLFYPALVYDTAAINCNNPYLSSAQATTLCGAQAGTAATVTTDVAYELNGPGSRPLTNQAINADYRLSGGVRGDVTDGWHYDVNFVTSQVYTSLSDNNEIDDASFIASLDAVSSGGKTVCASGGSCVPADIFSYHAVDPAFYGWAYRNYKWHSVTWQQDATANLTGDLTRYGIKSPWADDGVAVALGLEYRRDALRNVADAATAAYEGWLSNVGGHYSAKEVYGEAQIPLVEGNPFADSLTFNIGYRTSKYSNLGKGLPTSKYELLYRPVKDFLLRASFNNAARAPNVSELYSARSFSVNGSLADACAGATPGATLAQCESTGVTAAQYGHIPDCGSNCRTYAGGGNPLLRPEQAQTLTYGFVYTPHEAPGLLLSVDAYDILIKNFIGYLDAVDNFNKCLNFGLPFYCQYVHRDASTGALNGNGYVEGGTVNTYHLHNRGVDIHAQYAFGLGRWGRISTSMDGTMLAITGGNGTPDQPVTNCAGYFGNPNCYAPEPKWRHNLRATWQTPWANADLSLNWRHIGKTKFSGNSADPAVSDMNCCTSTFITHLAGYDYLDLAGAMKVSKALTLRLSIDNLLDKTPPVLPSQNVDGTTNNPNTYTGTYDPLGRAVLISLSYKM